MKNKKWFIFIAIFLIGVIVLYMITENEKTPKEFTQEEISAFYVNLEYAFCQYEKGTERDYYLPYEEINEGELFIRLACYLKETGEELTLDEIKQYLSSEYEPDGSLRIYCNGLHNKIEGYVNWHVENSHVATGYHISVIKVWKQYNEEHINAQIAFEDLSFEQLQKLIDKVNDPSIELDLS